MYAVIDMGGTNTRIGFSKDLKKIDEIEKFPTPKNLKSIRKEIQKKLKPHRKDIKAIVFGVAGIVNRETKQIIAAPHINEIKKLEIDNDFLGTEDIPIYVENDATLAALAESYQEYAKGYARVAYITISTGVGGALITNNRIPRTSYNFEPGHHIIDLDGDPLAFEDIKGSWESFSSGTAFEKIYQENPTDAKNSYVWQDYGENLAAGLHNISLLWRPDIIILGGSMTKKADLFLKETEKEMAKMLDDAKPPVVISKLDDQNGLKGALYLLKR